MNQYFVEIAVSLGMILLIWNCFEVGRNDAANLVNAVFGSRVMTRRRAVYIAGVFVVLGSIFASPVMDTVRKGIFDIEMLDAVKLISLYIGSYLVGTVLLYSYSAFGMPVSTTATLVFCLAGGAIGVGGSFEVVNWSTFTKVVSAIVISIFMSGIAGFFVQRIFRGAFDDKGEDHTTLLLHGPWVTGLMMTALTWFMAMKGLKGISFIEILRTEIIEQYGTLPVLLGYWAILTLAVYLLLLSLPKEKTKYLFHVTAVVGMCCLSFAFGQNDLANAVSPGLASFFIWKEGMASSVDIPRWALFTCGFIIFLGMGTKKAQRVTRAEINVASQYDFVELYAPEWCKKLAQLFIRKHTEEPIFPAPSLNLRNKKIHYDPLRASVIMAVSASVIASASGMGVPVSTTYVGFAAVLATGWGDKVFSGGDSDKKAGRAIWVITCWFLGGIIALIASAIMGRMIFSLGVLGLGLGLAINLGCRWYFDKISEVHEKRHHKSGIKN